MVASARHPADDDHLRLGQRYFIEGVANAGLKG
jgi:hypothetical protein